MFFRFVYFTILLASLFASSTAQAQHTTYVATNGVDTSSSNSCSFADPCRTIAFAAGVTPSGGTLVCLSPPDNTGFTLLSSITIDCAGSGFTESSIIINLNSSDTSQTVILKGLTCSVSPTSYCVNIVAAKSVILEGLALTGSMIGVYDHRSVAGTLTIKNSIIARNTGPGVVVTGPSGNYAVLDNVTLDGNAYGLAVAAGNRVSVVRSVVANNATAGVEADGGSFVIVEGSTISDNNVGIQSGSAIRLANNNIEFNTTAVNGATGTFGNNRFSGNGSDGTTLVPVGAGSTDLAQK